MKKKLFYSLIVFLLTFFGVNILFPVFGQGLQLGQDETILNIDSDNTLDVYDNNNPISDPLREGAYKIIDADSTDTISSQELGGIINPGLIPDHQTALNSTMSIIKNIINYSLGLLSFIALVYLIYHGTLMLTAAGDDAQYKKGMKGLRLAAIAITGIGLSWLIVSFIFWLIDYVT